MLIQLPTKLLYVVSKSSINHFVAYHLHYKEILKYAYDPFFQPLPQLLSLLGDLLDYIGKFAIYHLYYKEKLVMTEFEYNSSFRMPPQK